jgi:hypothetical protein
LQLCPDGDFSQELGGRFDKDAWIRTKGAAAALQTGDAPSPMQLPTPLSHVSRGSSDDDDLVPSDDEVPADFSLSKWLQELQLNPAGPRFVGKSSGVRLVKNALALKHDLTGIPKKDPKVLMRELQGRRPEYWNVHPVCLHPVTFLLEDSPFGIAVGTEGYVHGTGCSSARVRVP